MQANDALILISTMQAALQIRNMHCAVAGTVLPTSQCSAVAFHNRVQLLWKIIQLYAMQTCHTA